MDIGEATYLQQIRREIASLRGVLHDAPFLAAIGAAVVAESVTLNVFYIDLIEQPAYDGTLRHVTFSRCLSLLRNKQLIPGHIDVKLRRLLQMGNQIRHKHVRPDHEEAELSIVELEQIIDYLGSLEMIFTCQCQKQLRVRVSRYFDQTTYKSRPRCPICKTILLCVEEVDIRRWSNAGVV